MTAVPTREPARAARDQEQIELSPESVADVADVKRSIVAKLVTPGTTVGSIASLLAVYLIVRMESQPPRPQSEALTRDAAAALVADVAALKLSAATLVDSSRDIKDKVDLVDRRTAEMESALSLLRMSMQNQGFRLDAAERDINRLQSRRE